MKPRLILVSLGLVVLALLSLGLQAQEGTKSSVQPKDELSTSEKVLMQQFADFQEALLKLKQKLARGDVKDRERAKVLDKVLDECKNLAINQEFAKMIQLLRDVDAGTTGGLGKIQDQSNTIGEKLSKILRMLQDTSGNPLNGDIDLLKKFIKDLDARIKEQQIAEALTGRKNPDTKTLEQIQKEVTDKTKKLEKEIDKFVKGKEGKGGEAAPSKGENKDGGKEAGKSGEAKDAGKDKEAAKGAPKDAGQDSKAPKGETKPGADKGGQPSKSPDSDPKSGAKPAGDPKSGKEGAPPAGAKDNKGGDPMAKGKEGAAKDNKGGDKAGPNDKNKEGAPKDAGAKSGDPMKDPPQGAAKGDDKKAGGEPKSGDPKQGPPDSGAKAGGDPKPGGGAGETKPAEAKGNKGADKGGEGKGGDSKGGEGKQGESKSGEAKSGAAKDGGASPGPGNPSPTPPPSGAKGDNAPPPPPGGGDKKKDKDTDQIANSGKKLEEAGYDQQNAEKKITEGKLPDALKKQADAIAKMEEAKKKLENLLRQAREEEIERVLAALKARCEKMLMMQQQVLVGTIDTEANIKKRPDKKADRPDKVAAQALSDREKEIILEANKCIEILQGEGTAVAFPEVFQQLRSDMMQVQKRLDVADVHDVTQSIELDIIDTLKEMIAALTKAQEDNKSDPGKGGKPGAAGKPADPKLLELIQELKMVRSLQKRVNDRTDFYGKRFPGEQAADPQVIQDLRGLANRQQQIQQIVERIAKGDNQ